MRRLRCEVLICGAGIAGISAAYHLSVQHGVDDILLVDERSPLSLTSDKSTECYRNWWPGPDGAMVGLMNRSIDLLEALARESGNVFHLNRRGYIYATGNRESLPAFKQAALQPPRLGAGPLRVHSGARGEPPYQPAPSEGFEGQPDGADLISDRDMIREHFPYLSENTVAVLHVRRAGWFSAQQFGMYLLNKARAKGVRLINGRVNGFQIDKSRIQAVCLADGSLIETRVFVNAAGPLAKEVCSFLGIDIPVFSELHLKIAIKDHLKAIPRHAPLLIWSDPQSLSWSDEERTLLEAEENSRPLLDVLPSGVHTRPEGGIDSPMVLILWEYQTQPTTPRWPIPIDPYYPDVVVRGLATMLPAVQAYIHQPPRPMIDGGYYTKTRENRPVIGPLPVEGTFIIGALSGFGLMAACGAGELLAAHVAGAELPAYANAFSLERYSDPKYLDLLNRWGDSGQL